MEWKSRKSRGSTTVTRKALTVATLTRVRRLNLSQLTRLNNKILKILQNQSIITSHKVIYPEYNTFPPQLLHKYQILILVHKFLYHK